MTLWSFGVEWDHSNSISILSLSIEPFVATFFWLLTWHSFSLFPLHTCHLALSWTEDIQIDSLVGLFYCCIWLVGGRSCFFETVIPSVLLTFKEILFASLVAINIFRIFCSFFFWVCYQDGIICISKVVYVLSTTIFIPSWSSELCRIISLYLTNEQ